MFLALVSLSRVHCMRWRRAPANGSTGHESRKWMPWSWSFRAVPPIFYLLVPHLPNGTHLSLIIPLVVRASIHLHKCVAQIS